jgi:hypothetical protein
VNDESINKAFSTNTNHFFMNSTTNIKSKIRKTRGRLQFTDVEDLILKELVNQLGIGNWNVIASKMLNRTSPQCKDRYQSYLRPDLNKSPWTKEEDTLLSELFQKHGSKLKYLTNFFHNRSEINIKNWFYVH